MLNTKKSGVTTLKRFALVTHAAAKVHVRIASVTTSISFSPMAYMTREAVGAFDGRPCRKDRQAVAGEQPYTTWGTCGNVESCRANQYLSVSRIEVGRRWYNSL